MSEERVEVAASELVRWLAVAVLILAGLGLYVWLAPDAPAIAAPSVREVAS